MEAQQCVKLTGTNCSIGLIIASAACSGKTKPTKTRQTKQSERQIRFPPPLNKSPHLKRTDNNRLSGLHDLVAMARDDPPDPIPNSAVKTLSADGTASQGAGE